MVGELINYVLNSDSELASYAEWCHERGMSTEGSPDTRHIVGVALKCELIYTSRQVLKQVKEEEDGKGHQAPGQRD